MGTVHEILADVVAEQQALDQYLQAISDRDWALKTPHNRWTVHQHVAHLAAFEEYALDAIDGKGARLAEAADFVNFDAFVKDTANRGPRRSQEVIEWWRLSRAAVIDVLSRRDASQRVPWFAGKMAVKTFATSRLVDTWLHALDVHHTFGTEPDELPRLRHIAFFAFQALPYAFEVAGEDFKEPLRLELIGPGYTKWEFGSADSPNYIKGRAGEWCRVAVGRLHPDKATSLVPEGKVAEVALSVVRTYV
jgi:uncharacterized protein (TIGR03084 family)